MEQHSTTIGNVRLEWGRLERQDRRQKITFRREFAQTPVVMVSVETNDARAVETVEVAHDVRRKSFRVTNKEDYTVVYIAIGRVKEPGSEPEESEPEA
ncbi:hypothetical protein SAMN02745121_04535 [Nannocystis exedens]|uniref:Uncharacterized protein n=1 Tax=Nannocystis exedens TaxID=54 RepID=A0A1I2B8W4_9BACT|nr:hypothetical protein [Nannocystis exedens]PCC68120.1 hypothetical protein NAEX_01129 [Nannocystis exedens]SFE52581.1 hypothetical protein SAMN02745121_04535 [Nannocystis exedens]